MEIPFSRRSEFFEPIHGAIKAAGGCSCLNQALTVSLSRQGYPGKIRVFIREEEAGVFDAEWEGSDPTRFPARIRAAATVLRDLRCHGRFLISHQAGVLTITRA